MLNYFTKKSHYTSLYYIVLYDIQYKFSQVQQDEKNGL